MARDWSRLEVEATVADYFDMLAAELRGEPYNKSEHRRGLKPLLDDRSDSAIERKHQNISAILLELGERPILGYRPLSNYQQLLYDVVAERVAGESDLVGRGSLADRVEHVAVTVGDGEGFDVHSFEADGSDRFIEVETTRYARIDQRGRPIRADASTRVDSGHGGRVRVGSLEGGEQSPKAWGILLRSSERLRRSALADDREPGTFGRRGAVSTPGHLVPRAAAGRGTYGARRGDPYHQRTEGDAERTKRL